MIDIVQAPGRDRVIADGNDTVITVRSDYGQNSYVKFNVFIDDSGIPFKSMSAAKNDEGKASISLQRFYDDYFSNIFLTSSSTGFRVLGGLMAKVAIFVEERAIADDTAVGFLILPPFYIIKSSLPMAFDDTRFQLLDVPVREIICPPTGSLKFPFFTKENVVAKVSDDAGTIHLASTFVAPGSCIAEFTLDVGSLSLPPFCEWLTLTLKGANEVTEVITIPIVRNTIYPLKEVYFQNNCGAYVKRWIAGALNDDRRLSPQSYREENNSEVTYEIGEEAVFTLNSGYHSTATKNDILAIAKSMDVRMKINDRWQRLAASTKKVPFYADGEYLYEEKLVFSRSGILPESSIRAYMPAPRIDRFSSFSNRNQLVSITAADILARYTSDAAPEQIRFRSTVQNGQYGYEDAAGVYHTLFNSSTQAETSFTAVELPWADFSRLKYMPKKDVSGDPADSIDFQIFDGTLWSDIATIGITISASSGGASAPVIVVDGKQNILLDENGDGTLEIGAQITAPDGNAITIEWTAAPDSGISFSDSAIENPIVSITGASAEDENTISVQVIDTVTGLTAEQTVTLVAVLAQPSISASLNTGESSTTEKVFDVEVGPGIPNGTVKISVNGYFAGSARYALIDTEGSDTPPIASDVWKKFDISRVFGTSGMYNFKVKMVDETANDLVEIKLGIKELGPGMTPGTPNEITLVWP